MIINQRRLEKILENLKNISVEDINEKIKDLKVNNYCKEHGHLEDSITEYITAGSRHSPIVHGFCKRCYFPYKRVLTLEELEDYTKRIQAPMTI